MINYELPTKLKNLQQMSHQVAVSMLRPISRKYDRIEHCPTPEELVPLAQMRAQLSRKGGAPGAGESEPGAVRNGVNLAAVVVGEELCWGDVGLLLSIPGQGLGNAAISAVGTPEQKERFGKLYCAMAITEPEAGSDSAAVATTAVLDGDEWVLNGEKIFCTGGQRCEAVVVWATLDRSKGKGAIKSFIVPKGTPGLTLLRVEDKMGLRVSDTAALSFQNCRIPRDHLLGQESVGDTDAARRKAFGGVMQTFDNTRPAVAAMALGVARAALEITRELLAAEGVKADYARTLNNSTAIEAELYRMEADLEAARLMTWQAAWMADNSQPNSMQASMCKAKAGRMGTEVTLKCVELCGALGYSEHTLLEKLARDSKIIDIFEGTQQIQQLIVARHLLGLSSRELK
ncbi:acyl-CoA dehydrogenase family protein [Isoalcanivorax beigongshangi]|uniref:Acyl-CoA dehydrogenase family protein n=1 Tax=Isoalcanivorax beigongshangi TaxID=3238810 RepID=A0ABV4AGW8_9GAMM